MNLLGLPDLDMVTNHKITTQCGLLINDNIIHIIIPVSKMKTYAKFGRKESSIVRHEQTGRPSNDVI